jgi:hypothetical protein
MPICQGQAPLELIGRYLNRLAEKSLRLADLGQPLYHQVPFVTLFPRMAGQIDAGRGLDERE